MHGGSHCTVAAFTFVKSAVPQMHLDEPSSKCAQPQPGVATQSHSPSIESHTSHVLPPAPKLDVSSGTHFPVFLFHAQSMSTVHSPQLLCAAHSLWQSPQWIWRPP